MLISFKDGSKLDVSVTDANKIILGLAARDGKDRNKLICNSVEITKEDFLAIVEEVRKKINL